MVPDKNMGLDINTEYRYNTFIFFHPYEMKLHFLFKEDLKQKKDWLLMMFNAITDFPRLAACSNTALEMEVLTR